MIWKNKFRKLGIFYGIFLMSCSILIGLITRANMTNEQLYLAITMLIIGIELFKSTINEE